MQNIRRRLHEVYKRKCNYIFPSDDEGIANVLWRLRREIAVAGRQMLLEIRNKLQECYRARMRYYTQTGDAPDLKHQHVLDQLQALTSEVDARIQLLPAHTARNERSAVQRWWDAGLTPATREEEERMLNEAMRNSLNSMPPPQASSSPESTPPPSPDQSEQDKLVEELLALLMQV